MESPRNVLLFSSMVLLIFFFSQVITVDAKVTDNHQMIQVLGKQAVKEANNIISWYYKFNKYRWITAHLYTFNGILESRRQKLKNGATLFTLSINAYQPIARVERKLIAVMRVVGRSRQFEELHFAA